MCLNKHSLERWYQRNLDVNFTQIDPSFMLNYFDPRENLTMASLRKRLRELRLQKYYEHIPYLLAYHNGDFSTTIELSDREQRLAVKLYSLIWRKCTRTLWTGRQGTWCVNPDYLARALLEYAVRERAYFQKTCFDERWHQKYKIRKQIPRLFCSEELVVRLLQKSFRLYQKRKETAITTLQKQWRRCVRDPNFSVCRQRLKSEFDSGSVQCLWVLTNRKRRI